MFVIPCRARWAALSVLVVGGAACGRADLARDLDDPTPPATTLAAAGTLGHPSYVDVDDGARLRVAPGAEVTLKATAVDDDGVGRVELHVDELLVCPRGGPTTARRPPPFAPAPMWSGNGTDATTPAPTTLTATYVLETAPAPAGCVAEWDVRAVATNAARTPVRSSGPHAVIGLDPLVLLARPT